MKNDWTVSMRDEDGKPCLMKLSIARGCSLSLEKLPHTGRHHATVRIWVCGEEHTKVFLRDASETESLADSTDWAEERAIDYLTSNSIKMSEALSALQPQKPRIDPVQAEKPTFHKNCLTKYEDHLVRNALETAVRLLNAGDQYAELQKTFLTGTSKPNFVEYRLIDNMITAACACMDGNRTAVTTAIYRDRDVDKAMAEIYDYLERHAHFMAIPEPLPETC